MIERFEWREEGEVRKPREGKETASELWGLEREVHKENESLWDQFAYILPVQKYQNVLFNLKRARNELSGKTLRNY